MPRPYDTRSVFHVYHVFYVYQKMMYSLMYRNWLDLRAVTPTSVVTAQGGAKEVKKLPLQGVSVS